MSQGPWRRQACSKLRTRDSNSGSVIVEPASHDVADLGERSSHRAFRPARVLGDLRDPQALQAELQHATAEGVDLREDPLQLVGQGEGLLGSGLA